MVKRFTNAPLVHPPDKLELCIDALFGRRIAAGEQDGPSR